MFSRLKSDFFICCKRAYKCKDISIPLIFLLLKLWPYLWHFLAANPIKYLVSKHREVESLYKNLPSGNVRHNLLTLFSEHWALQYCISDSHQIAKTVEIGKQTNLSRWSWRKHFRITCNPGEGFVRHGKISALRGISCSPCLNTLLQGVHLAHSPSSLKPKESRTRRPAICLFGIRILLSWLFLRNSKGKGLKTELQLPSCKTHLWRYLPLCTGKRRYQISRNSHPSRRQWLQSAWQPCLRLLCFA